MIDHIVVTVSNFANSKQFYLKALAPIDYSLIMEFPTGQPDGFFAGFGVAPKADFCIASGVANVPPVHVGLRVAKRALVDAFYAAAMAAGARDNGAPGLRLHYHPNYYAAFVLDLDGHNIEAVCHDPE